MNPPPGELPMVSAGWVRKGGGGMARKRNPIFPLFEDVRRVTASLSDEQFGQAVRYALGTYYGDFAPDEPDALTKFAATVLLEQAARYDSFREQQRMNRTKAADESIPDATMVRQVQPLSTNVNEVYPSDPPSPSPIPSPIPSPSDTMCLTAIRLLNDLSGSRFRETTKATQRLIQALEKEGYTQEDIEAVIRHKCSQWSKDAKMGGYLRPQTLFGSKFESYLSDARRNEPKQETGYSLAPVDDPWDTAIREGSYV